MSSPWAHGDAKAGDFAETWCAEHGGVVASDEFDARRLPEDFRRELQRRTELRFPKPQVPDGSVPNAPKAVDMRHVLRRAPGGRLRVLVLFAGGGGSAVGIEMCPGAVVTAAVEIDALACKVYKANHPGTAVAKIDLSEPAEAARRLQALGMQWDCCQLSPPCGDYSRMGNRVEGPNAELTVKAFELVARLGIPTWIMENVPEYRESVAWRRAARQLRRDGYGWAEARANSKDHGVPQERKRSFVLGAMGAGRQELQRFPAVLAEIAGTRPVVTVAEALPEVKGAFYLPPSARTPGEGVGVRSSAAVPGRRGAQWSGIAPTLTTGCGTHTSALTYAPRRHDVAPITEATLLSPAQLGVIGGFPADHSWPVSRTRAGKIIGNAVSPPVMRDVLLAAQATGLLSSEKTAEASRLQYDLHERLERRRAEDAAEQAFDDASWRAAAAALLEQSAEADNRARRGKAAARRASKPDWGLDRPRRAQHPATVEWRRECEKRGLPTLTAGQEERLGLGVRGARTEDEPPLLTPDHPAWQAAMRRIESGSGLAGLPGPITGWPNSKWREWRASGAPAHQVERLRCGARLHFTGKVPPIGCGGADDDGNLPGTREPVFDVWLYGVVMEYLALGIMIEIPTRGYVSSPLNCIGKGDFDPVHRPHRVRCLLDQRKLNERIKPAKFGMDTLHKCRNLFDSRSVMLQWDISSAFFHLAVAPEHRKFLACSVGGRTFEWTCAPMGTSSSPLWFAQLGFIISKRLRAAGVRLVLYADDLLAICLPEEAAAVSHHITAELERLGLLVNAKKSHPEPRRQATALGIDVCLDSMTFALPMEKKAKALAEIDEILAAAAAGEPVRVRTVARAVGRLMSMHIVLGNAVRRLTRASYAFITAVTGVAPDCPRRELRVAWDKMERIDVAAPAAVEELKYWRLTLPGVGPAPIVQVEPLATVVTGTDAGDAAWAGFFDNGDGARKLARDIFIANEGRASSTLREAWGCLRNLQTFREDLERHRGEHVLVLTDSQAMCRALEVGSRTPAVQEVVDAICRLAVEVGVTLHCSWLRRSHRPLQLLDDGSKWQGDAAGDAVGDSADYRICPQAFAEIERRFQVRHTVDLFATASNTLLPRFFSPFFSPGAAGCNAFAFNWGEEGDCWIHPPRSQIARCVRWLQRCEGRGTLLCPLSTREYWFALVRRGAPGTVPGGRFVLRRRRGLLTHAGVTPLAASTGDLLAVRLDFRGGRDSVASSAATLGANLRWQRLRRAVREGRMRECHTGG